jgi:uncharacterized protein (TIGR00268 family)
LVFLPEETQVDPKTGSRYELDSNNNARINEDFLETYKEFFNAPESLTLAKELIIDLDELNTKSFFKDGKRIAKEKKDEKRVNELKDEINEAKNIARRLKVKHKLIKTSPLENPKLKYNPKDRCYICKKSLFIKFLNLADKYGYSYLVDGTNFDDLKSSRPGLKALAELGVKSPLAEAELTKKDIRKYSKIMGLPTWDSPALACLATRIPYGEEITEPKLQQIDLAEEFIRSLGFKQVRVRYHFPIARIELDPGSISNIIKPSLTTGRLRVIGSTTYDEYKKEKNNNYNT